MLVHIRPPLLSLSIRIFHTSSQAWNRIAPPDPISHMRSVIYDDGPAPSPPSLLRHPYSLSEFNIESTNRAGGYELQFKLQRQQLDALNQNFWFDSNTRFEEAKRAVLAALPPSATALDKENALSEFYKQWYMQEADRTNEYTDEWRKRNIALILIAARIEYQRVATRLSDMLSFKKSQ